MKFVMWLLDLFADALYKIGHQKKGDKKDAD